VTRSTLLAVSFAPELLATALFASGDASGAPTESERKAAQVSFREGKAAFDGYKRKMKGMLLKGP
jgi:NADH dehydrogenase FAD-containing subunit